MGTVLALLTLSCAAAMGGGGGAVKNDLDDLRLSLDRLRQEEVETRSRVDAMQQNRQPQGEDLPTLVQDLRDRLDLLDARMSAMAQRLQDNDDDLAGLRYDILRLNRLGDESLSPAATGAPTGTRTGMGSPGADLEPGTDRTETPKTALLPSSPPVVESGQDPTGIFQQAYADYTRGDYNLAAMGFRTALARDPSGPLADDALYYLGEVAAAEGRKDEALAGYARVVDDFPRGDKAPAALLKRGLLLIEHNRIGEGVVQLDHLVKTYPQSEEARLARNKLRALGVGF
jgi:TolA-binding protein